MVRNDIHTYWKRCCCLFVHPWFDIIARIHSIAGRTGNSWPGHMIQRVGMVKNDIHTYWKRCCGLFVYAWFDMDKTSTAEFWIELAFSWLQIETYIGQIFGIQAQCYPCDITLVCRDTRRITLVRGNLMIMCCSRDKQIQIFDNNIRGKVAQVGGSPLI
jgi:hypothetical protein